MRLAIWNEQAAEFIVSGFTSGAVASPFDIQRHPRATCTKLLKAGKVDLALVPTLTVLRDHEDYDALPAVALSTWDYPFAQLVLRGGLGDPFKTLAFDPRYAQEAVLSRVVLAEHYQQEPSFVPYEAPTREQLLAAPEDASLHVGPDVPLLRTDRITMDLGQEWYELANYPMVWGLFAARKDEGVSEMVHALRASAEAAEAQRGLWMQAQEAPARLHAFYQDDLRVRLDDLAIASLTTLQQHLFSFGVLDEVPGVPFIAIEDDEPSAPPPLM